MSRPRIGLALSSGVGRGWAHIGVLRALEELGVDAEVVAGSSIGAVVAAVHMAGRLPMLEAWARGLNRVRIVRYLDVRMRRGGMIGGRRLNRILQDNLGALAIEDLPRPLTVVATELETGHEAWLSRGPLVPALQASYALPGIFPPVEIDGQRLVDGALVNPVPVSVCRAMGARLVIAVNLNADLQGRGRRREARRNAAGQSLLDGVVGLGRAGEPGPFQVMATSLAILQDRLSRSRLAGDPPDVTIAPRVGHIGLLEFDRAEELIAAGRIAVEQARPQLEETLAVLG